MRAKCNDDKGQKAVHIHTVWHRFESNQITENGQTNTEKRKHGRCNESTETVAISTGNLSLPLAHPFQRNIKIVTFLLAQQNNNEPAPRPSMPSGAHGMPVQVFPTGPPPPPPAPSKSQLSAPNNANRSPSPSRKSPAPQSFEPPPLGLRPEIKIPPNPMATLRKVPTPKPKDDFWVEEYKRERSKSPLPGSVEANQQSSNQKDNDLPEPICQMNSTIQQNNNVPPRNEQINKIDSPQPTLARQSSLKNDFNQNNNFVNNNNSSNFNHNFANNNQTLSNQTSNSPQQRIYSPFSSSSPTPNLPKPLSPIKLTQDNNVPIYVRSTQRKTSPSPTPVNNINSNGSHESHQETPTYYVRSHQRPNATPPPPAPPAPTLQKQPSLEQPRSSAPAHPQNIPIYTRPARSVAPSPPTLQKQASFEKPQPQIQQRPQYQPQPQYQQQANENVPIYVRSFQSQPRVLSPPPANSLQNVS